MFNVSVTITNIVGLNHFEFNMSYASPLEFIMIQSNFVVLYTSDASTMSIKVDNKQQLSGINGKFTLATLTFTATTPGNCTIYLNTWNFTNSTGGPIAVAALNSSFATSTPYAYFTMNDKNPPVNAVIEFNASQSYDPDNPNGVNYGIKYYTWDFRDNTTAVNQTLPTIAHNYTNSGTYNVTLTVTDFDSNSWTYVASIVVGEVDIKVVNVTLTPTSMNNVTYTISMVNITVYLSNNGGVDVAFNVTVYGNQFNATVIPVNVSRGEIAQVFLSWNVTSIPKCNCTICCNATLEDNLNQTNNFAQNVISLGVACDLNGDGRCGLADLVILANAYGSKPGDLKWNPIADIDGNGIVGLSDLVLLANHYGNIDP